MSDCCKEFDKFLSDSAIPVSYNPIFREYSIQVLDGGTSKQLIAYCPWCGEALPESLRDKWFDIVYDELELDGPDDPNLPEDMKSDNWWLSRKVK